jgi:hypothetical protein
MFRKIKDVIWWLRYRIDPSCRYYVVKCDGLKPGYHEIEERMLHSMFGLLRHYVEHELEDTAEHGLEHLDWAASLRCDDSTDDADMAGKPTPQAEAAMEVKTLYLWWTRYRPGRIDPGVASGSDEACRKCFPPCGNPPSNDWGKRNERPLFLDWTAKCKIHAEIEERYHAEDDAMMKRLVDIRQSLWT